ncbi:MAG: c-type cytochrome [Acidobacteria bacterium]|nr:c-type cytochrome [Acidobacteriota bacterium]
MGSMAILLAALPIVAQEPVRNPHTTPADIEQGAKTFRSHCAACHGFAGTGGRGPNLTTGVFYRGGSDADLLRNISDGIEGTEMPALFYSPDRVWQVIAYLRSIGSGAGKVAGNAAQGQKVYASNGCAKCHRVSAEGGRLGPDLTSIGRYRAAGHLKQAIVAPNEDVRQRYWFVSARKGSQALAGFLMNEDTYTVQFMDMNENLRSESKSDLKEYKVEKVSKMPAFKLKDSDLDDLVAYLASLKGGSR